MSDIATDFRESSRIDVNDVLDDIREDLMINANDIEDLREDIVKINQAIAELAAVMIKFIPQE